VVSDGRYAYIDPLIDPGYEVMVFDCVDPAHPIQIASIPIEVNFWGLLGVTKNTLYLGIDQGLIIYDVSDPYHPVFISQYEPVGGMLVFNMVFAGDIAYLSGSPTSLVILDISDPLHPSLLGSNSEEFSIYVSLVQDPYLYALSPGKFLVYDVSNPA
jgi:hypothetical protein